MLSKQYFRKYFYIHTQTVNIPFPCFNKKTKTKLNIYVSTVNKLTLIFDVAECKCIFQLHDEPKYLYSEYVFVKCFRGLWNQL